MTNTRSDHLNIKIVHFGKTGDCGAVLQTTEQVLSMENLSEETKAIVSDVMDTIEANRKNGNPENCGVRAAVKLGMLLERQSQAMGTGDS